MRPKRGPLEPGTHQVVDDDLDSGFDGRDCENEAAAICRQLFGSERKREWEEGKGNGTESRTSFHRSSHSTAEVGLGGTKVGCNNKPWSNAEK